MRGPPTSVPMRVEEVSPAFTSCEGSAHAALCQSQALIGELERAADLDGDDFAGNTLGASRTTVPDPLHLVSLLFMSSPEAICGSTSRELSCGSLHSPVRRAR